MDEDIAERLFGGISRVNLFLIANRPALLYNGSRRKKPVMKGKEVNKISRGYKHDAANPHTIDLLASESGLKGWNAGLKAAVSMAAVCLCIAADKPAVSLFIILSMAYITVAAGGMPVAGYLKQLAIPFVFLFMGTAAVAVEITGLAHSICANTAYADTGCAGWCLHLTWFAVYVTKAGLCEAAGLLARALGAVSAMYMMVLATPVSELIGVLKRLHVPKVIIELMYLIYRFIFVLGDTHRQMRQAAASRLGYSDFTASCRTFGSTAANLLIVSLKKADTYYDALLARCYDGDLCFLEEERRITSGQAAAAAGYLLTIAAVWLAAAAL